MNNIGDYALIGDCHSAALVGRDASIDWACFPRFDSPSVFAANLDADRGGSFRVRPHGVLASSREYVEGTNVLVTTFTCDSGAVEITDCMPVERLDPSDPRSVVSHASILRRIRCTDGSVSLGLRVEPRFEYGLYRPRFLLAAPHAAEAVGGADALYVHASLPLEVDQIGIGAWWHLEAGEEVWVDATWRPSHEPKTQTTDPAAHAVEGARRLEATIAFWREWLAGSWYDGPYKSAVQRSALALKAMTYAPTGAMVAAPTTSLPEQVGGSRNWDYRYTWIRDTTLALTSLFILGFTEEASAFKDWLERTGAGRPEDLQIMYGIGGERMLPERELEHLKGHRGSEPVRVGNGAVKQMQLDSYGQILEAAWLFSSAGGEITDSNWVFLSGLATIVVERWRLPDQGVWEMRDDPRHFTHSKLNCWVALDRAVRMARANTLPGPVELWEKERDLLRDYLLEQCAPAGWFQQAAENAVPDAATLLIAASGFIATDDPLSLETIEVVRRSLERDGLVYRYLSPDGLDGSEGAFLLCSFWLLDALIFAGELDEATALLERLLGMANDVGLFAEEIDVASGEALGNFPQAFSHMALVLSCAHLEAAREGAIPTGPVAYADTALRRGVARIAARPV